MVETGKSLTDAERDSLAKFSHDQNHAFVKKFKLDSFQIPAMSPEQAEKLRQRIEDREQRERKAKTVKDIGTLRRDVGERLCPYAKCLLDNFEIYDDEQQRAVNKLRVWIDHIEEFVPEGRGIFFIGPPGTGKDHLAIAVTRAIMIRLRITARWVDGATLRSELRDAIKTSEKEKKILYCYINAGVLILSDPVAVGSKLTDYQADTIFRIVDGRYRANRPTFVTANFQDETEANSAIGSQTLDRLSHGCLRIRCKWESYRRRKNDG